jgi:hypothetical protein
MISKLLIRDERQIFLSVTFAESEDLLFGWQERCPEPELVTCLQKLNLNRVFDRILNHAVAITVAKLNSIRS